MNSESLIYLTFGTITCQFRPDYGSFVCQWCHALGRLWIHDFWLIDRHPTLGLANPGLTLWITLSWCCDALFRKARADRLEPAGQVAIQE